MQDVTEQRKKDEKTFEEIYQKGFKFPFWGLGDAAKIPVECTPHSADMANPLCAIHHGGHIVVEEATNKLGGEAVIIRSMAGFIAEELLLDIPSKSWHEKLPCYINCRLLDVERDTRSLYHWNKLAYITIGILVENKVILRKVVGDLMSYGNVAGEFYQHINYVDDAVLPQHWVLDDDGIFKNTQRIARNVEQRRWYA